MLTHQRPHPRLHIGELVVELVGHRAESGTGVNDGLVFLQHGIQFGEHVDFGYDPLVHEGGILK